MRSKCDADAGAALEVLRSRADIHHRIGIRIAALKAPLDLLPKTELVTLTLPPGTDIKGGSVSVEISGKLPEITQMNNQVQF